MSNDIFRIGDSDCWLTFQKNADEYLVQIGSHHFNATQSIDLDAESRLLDGDNITAFFAKISNDWKGWEDELVFETLDRNFFIVATHDGLGHIQFIVKLVCGTRWTASVNITLTPAQLSQIVLDAKLFFYAPR